MVASKKKDTKSKDLPLPPPLPPPPPPPEEEDDDTTSCSEEDPDYDPYDEYEEEEEEEYEEDEEDDEEDDDDEGEYEEDGEEDDEEDGDEEDGEEEEEDDAENLAQMMPMIIIQAMPSGSGSKNKNLKRKYMDAMAQAVKMRRSERGRGNAPEGGEEEGSDMTRVVATFSPDEKGYWLSLSKSDKSSFVAKYKSLQKKDAITTVPLRFKIIESDLDSITKKMILAKIDQFNMMHNHTGEYFKLRNWLNNVYRLPLSKYNKLPIDNITDSTQCANFLSGVRTSLNKTVYGHKEAKEQILCILAQWISNPSSKGHCIGIQGAAGVGKTSFVKDGLCKALGLPFGFVALGGASDASFLDGHGFTYEGSTYGKIAEVLMKAQCMNPVIFFDELDKVSNTHRGDEIIGVLTHLTDSSQNERFNDRYFGEIDLNLSKSLIIFSYNDESAINPILKDRMITIRVKGYDQKDKLTIAKDYLLPDILKQYNFATTDVVFSDEILTKIIRQVPDEQGVRNLKRGLEAIVSWINMHRYIPVESKPITTTQQSCTSKTCELPICITTDHINKYVKIDERAHISKALMHTMYT